MKKVVGRIGRGNATYYRLAGDNEYKDYDLCHNGCVHFISKVGCYIRQRLMKLSLIHGVLPSIWECRGYESIDDNQLKLGV